MQPLRHHPRAVRGGGSRHDGVPDLPAPAAPAPSATTGAVAAGGHHPPVSPAVWYGCYGSNLSTERFRYYLAGGAPRGSTRAQPGCRDRSAPTGDRAVTLPGAVHFAHHATGWGGAVAFLDVAAAGSAPGRAYRVSEGQLADVVAQENGRPPGSVDVDVAAVLAAGRLEVCPGWYGTVAYVGQVDGEPLVTITSAWSAADVEPAPPSAAYLRTIAAGLVEVHRWSTAEVVAHLETCPGVGPDWTTARLTAALVGGVGEGGDAGYSTPRR